MKIVIAVNNLMQIAQPAYANHCQFWFRLGRSMPEHDFVFFNPQRMSIDRMRNEAAKIALEIEADYLVFLDDDVLIPYDGLAKLLASDYSITAGVTLIRGYPFYPMLFDFKQKDGHYIVDWKERESPEEFPNDAPADAVGFSFCAIATSVLREVSKPYFITGPNFTEDVFFCQKVNRELGPGLIGYRKDVETGHVLGLDIIAPAIRSERIAFEEACDPDIFGRKAIIDRSGDYLSMIREKENAEV